MISKQMGLFTILLVVVIVLAIVGLGWKTFSIGVINGYDRALERGSTLVKDLTSTGNGVCHNPSLSETNPHT